MIITTNVITLYSESPELRRRLAQNIVQIGKNCIMDRMSISAGVYRHTGWMLGMDISNTRIQEDDTKTLLQFTGINAHLDGDEE